MQIEEMLGAGNPDMSQLDHRLGLGFNLIFSTLTSPSMHVSPHVCVCPNRTLKGLSLSWLRRRPISRDSQSPATRPLNRAARLPRPHGIWTRVVSLGDSRISSSLSLEHPSRKDSTHVVPPKTKIPGAHGIEFWGLTASDQSVLACSFPQVNRAVWAGSPSCAAASRWNTAVQHAGRCV